MFLKNTKMNEEYNAKSGRKYETRIKLTLNFFSLVTYRWSVRVDEHECLYAICSILFAIVHRIALGACVCDVFNCVGITSNDAVPCAKPTGSQLCEANTVTHTQTLNYVRPPRQLPERKFPEHNFFSCHHGNGRW